MAELKKLEFFLLRYMPDVIKGEFVNFGLVLLEQGQNGAGFAGVRFTKDWRALECLDPQADVELLQAMEHDIQRRLVDVKDREEWLRKLEDSCSHLVQLSPMNGVLAEDPEKEIEALAKAYFRRIHGARSQQVSGRRAILDAMDDAFQTAGITKLMLRDLPAATYTRPGDPLRLDYGYPLGDAVHFLHAVSLQAGVDQGVILASRFPLIVKGIRDSKQTEASLTAVVDAGLDTTRPEVGFALGMMQESGMAVRPVTEVAQIAEGIRLELNA